VRCLALSEFWARALGTHLPLWVQSRFTISYAATDTEGSQAFYGIAPLHILEQGHQNPSHRNSDRMAQVMVLPFAFAFAKSQPIPISSMVMVRGCKSSAKQ
jgi:hypothetical protein